MSQWRDDLRDGLREGVRTRVAAVQWQRGVRALLAIGSAMTVCHILGLAPGPAALGGFDALLVDNGGPYRTRLITMSTVLLGGAAALMIGSLVPQGWFFAVAATMVFCFAVTFARVLSQPVASSSVLIMVLYFAGLGGIQHSWGGALLSAEVFLRGGLWAVALSLVLWPLDPFRPARLAVAACYRSLAEFTAQAGAAEGLLSREREGAAHEDAQRAAYEWRHRQRVSMEAARRALAATAARAPSRTIRARNLTVLLETADLLMARLIRVNGLTDLARTTFTESRQAEARLKSLLEWLAAAEHSIAEALVQKPADRAISFARDGSRWMQFITRRRDELSRYEATAAATLLHHLRREERDSLLEIEVTFDAVRALWTGLEQRSLATSSPSGDAAAQGWDLGWIDSNWMETLSANWTMHSAMLRHALRLTIVGAVDVVVMRLIHVNHGYWLPVTSIVLLQPFSAGTARKSMQRVTGTVAGGILAAVLAAAVTNPLVMIAAITVLAALAVATFAVDYAIYCFFLTPAFVLLSLPHPHDWRYAGIRIGTTLLGALIALAAMRLLWPERAEEELARLLRGGVEACSAYLRALLRFWQAAAQDAASRRNAEREILAPARRLCGLASNDAEEAVDRVMQEPHFGLGAERQGRLRDEALTFATYLRRLTQSITTMASVGGGTATAQARVEQVALRLDAIAHSTPDALSTDDADDSDASMNELAEEQMKRIERQASVLARSAAALSGS